MSALRGEHVVNKKSETTQLKNNPDFVISLNVSEFRARTKFSSYKCATPTGCKGKDMLLEECELLNT